MTIDSIVGLGGFYDNSKMFLLAYKSVIIRQVATSQAIRQMQLKSRIKSMTQYSVKGERIFPSQLMSGDVNRSIQLLAIRQKQAERVGHGNLGFTPLHHPQVFRVNHRQSVDIGYQRCHTARPSQDFSRFSLAFESEKASQLDGQLSKRVDHPSQRYSEARDIERFSKFSEDDPQLPAFKPSKTNQSKAIEALPFSFQGNHFDKIKLDATLKQVQQQKTKPDNEESPIDRIYKKLYNQYRNLYQRAQKDNDQLMVRFRKVDNLVEELQREKGKMQEELRERRKVNGRVEELEEKILGLEESIKTNRRINDALMRKEQDYENKVREMEEKQIRRVKEMNILKQEMDGLSKECERLKEENIHLDGENIRLDSENVRLSQLYEHLTKDFDQNPKTQDFLKLSSQLTQATAENCFLQQSNEQLHITLLQLTESLKLYHERISWMQGFHKQLQQNLVETQEELIRVGLKFVNYKLCQNYQDKQQQEQSSNCSPSFDQAEEQEKQQQFEAKTNHIISSDSDDQKHIKTLQQRQDDQIQAEIQQVQSIS